MPDVVVVVEHEEFALRVHVPRLCGRHHPVGGGRHVEGQGPDPGHQGDTEVEERLSCDPLSVPQLHQDVVAGVEQQVADQHLQQEPRKVSILLSYFNNLDEKDL